MGLTWNGQYQLTNVFNNGVSVEQNAFDALGRRVWTSDGTTNYYMVYDGAHVLAEVNSTGGLLRAYTHGPGIDNWLAMTVYTNGTAQTYFYISDHLGTVHAVTDGNGNIVESYKYDAWGRVLGVFNSNGLAIAQSAIGNRILWQGREYSWATGLYYFRARWYDPITGRWLSNDPAGIAGGLNQYVFCSDNPVNFRDPFGLCTEGGGYQYPQIGADPSCGIPPFGGPAVEPANPTGHGMIVEDVGGSYYAGGGGGGVQTLLLDNGQVVTYAYGAVGAGFGGGGGNLGVGEVYGVYKPSDYAGPFASVSGGAVGGGSVSGIPNGAASYTAGASTLGVNGSVQVYIQLHATAPLR
jgi:RHS repeat-associated protein